MEEKIEVELNKQDVQSIIDCYEKDIKYIKKLEKENQQLKNKIKQAVIYIKNIDENEFINTEHYTEILNKIEKR